MSKRSRNKPRCYTCWLTPATCICAGLPRVQARTPLVVVQHVGEQSKPTNTARLLAAMVEGVQILPFGMREPAFDPGPLADEAVRWFVLFPQEGAPVLGDGATSELVSAPDQTTSTSTAEADSTILASDDPRPRGFVILDGTWHQCSRMSRRVPVVGSLPCVALPPGPPSIWSVRTQHDIRGVSTIEAGLRVLELVEGVERFVAVRRAFAEATARLLFLKGKLPAAEVPAAWGL